MKISVFGTGYVGLVTGTCFAEMGNEVICADIDETKIANLQKGISPIYEPGLDQLISSNMKGGRLIFTTDLKKATQGSDLLFIAVGTPPNEDGSADLQYVIKVAESIGESLTSYKVIINKSTVPVGTAKVVQEKVSQTLKSRKMAAEFDVVSNPEFLKEGTAIEDCLKPYRVILGCESPRALGIMEQLYEPFLRNGHPLLRMDILSAEMTKYAANAMLATKISFMNELSRLCERTGSDIEAVRQGIGSDPRIGYAFIYPGLGYGGSCFPKDVRALIEIGASFEENMDILRAVESTNQLQRTRFFQKMERYFHQNSSEDILGKSYTDGFRGKKIAIWGLSFKPGTDDLREAPALDLIERLTKAGATISAFDPVSVAVAKATLKDHSMVNFSDNMYDALDGAHALVIATEWLPFREPNIQKMKAKMKAPVIFDGRNIYDPKLMKKEGFEYFGIGRPV